MCLCVGFQDGEGGKNLHLLVLLLEEEEDLKLEVLAIEGILLCGLWDWLVGW